MIKNSRMDTFWIKQMLTIQRDEIVILFRHVLKAVHPIMSC